MLSFGEIPSAIDWIWMKTIVNEPTEHVVPPEHAELYYIAQLITELDPADFDAYATGSTFLTIIRDDNLGAHDLLLKAQEFRRKTLPNYPKSFRNRVWAQEWTIPMTLAYVELFELNDLHAASRSFQDAAESSNAPEYLPRLAERLRRPGGEYEVGMKLLNFMIAGARTDEQKAKLEKRRYNLFVAQYRYDLEGRFKSYLSDQPLYRSRQTLSAKEMQNFWSRFLKENSLPSVDPWGGRVSLNSQGRVVTSTPYEKVFGLE